MGLNFQWDRAKAAANLRKHGISFEDAGSAFGDPLSISIPDPDHSESEERLVLLGMTQRHRLVVVVHIEQGDTIRIISARPATSAERRDYEEEQS